MRKRNVVLISILVVIVLIAVAVVVGQKVLQSNLDRIVQMEIKNVSLAKVPDGTYLGQCKAFPVEAEVKVTMSGHQIKDVQLVKHVNGQGAPAEVIPSQVVKAQTLEVDLITGATYSSKVILKAIEDALNKAGQ